MNLGLVFVGGIHGVGKSSLCSNLASALNLRHLSAGELIRGRREATPSVDKHVLDVDDNQDVLVGAVQAIPIGDSSVLLDGHFCLLNSLGQITRIPTNTFKQLAPVAVLVLQDDVRAIRDRLQGRDGNEYSLELLTTLQDAELNHAQEVCSAIGTELRILHPRMLAECKQFISQQLAAKNL